VPLEVGTSDIDDVALHLETGFTIKGVVRLVSQSERPIPGRFFVGLRSSDPVIGDGQITWAQDHSSFSITNVTPGNYRLQIFPPPPLYVKSATIAGQDILGHDLPLSQMAGPIDIQLRDDGGSTEIVVVDANDQPAHAGVVVLRGGIPVATLINNTGHFKLDLAPEEHTICAWDDLTYAEYLDPGWMQRNGGGCQTVMIISGQYKQIKLVQQIAPK
jgi:hypothetical protein